MYYLQNISWEVKSDDVWLLLLAWRGNPQDYSKNWARIWQTWPFSTYTFTNKQIGWFLLNGNISCNIAVMLSIIHISISELSVRLIRYGCRHVMTCRSQGTKAAAFFVGHSSYGISEPSFSLLLGQNWNCCRYFQGCFGRINVLASSWHLFCCRVLHRTLKSFLSERNQKQASKGMVGCMWNIFWHRFQILQWHLRWTINVLNIQFYCLILFQLKTFSEGEGGGASRQCSLISVPNTYSNHSRLICWLAHLSISFEDRDCSLGVLLSGNFYWRTPTLNCRAPTQSV